MILGQQKAEEDTKVDIVLIELLPIVNIDIIDLRLGT